LLIQDKFLRIDDTPEAIIGTVGAGSIYSNIYKRFAKGTSEKTASDILVPAPECGSYKYPAPGYTGEPEEWD
jgi:predicted alternative tryptophan synthase beta-subunit